jgi:hypothetical protein
MPSTNKGLIPTACRSSHGKNIFITAELSGCDNGYLIVLLHMTDEYFWFGSKLLSGKYFI